MKAFQFAANQLWAIEESYLTIILNISQRVDTADLEAVAQKQADRASKDGLLQQYGTVGVVNVIGPIFRYANLFTQISGATSVQALAATIGAVTDDPNIESVILNLDSPGGELAGISDLAKLIAKMNMKKPVVAYVDDMGASGAYWLAVAARSIVASDTAKVGSVGVIATVVEDTGNATEKRYRFISSISPNKRPDLETDEGRASIQVIVDDLGAVFAKAVADGRGISIERVISTFGQGGLVVAARAKEAGMIDEIGTLEGLMDRMKSGQIPQRQSITSSASAEESALSTSVAKLSATNSQNKRINTMKQDEVADKKTPPEPGMESAPPPPEAAAPVSAAPAIVGEVLLLAPFERAKQIVELCALAGLSARQSLAFLKAEASVDAVRQELLTARVAEGGPEIQAHILPDAGVVGTKPEDSLLVKAAEKAAAEHAARTGGQ